MDLVAYALPFFVLAIVVELAYGLIKQRNTYRLNDSVSSLFLGVLSQARRIVTLGVGGYFYYLVTQHFSLELMDASHWFTWVLAMVLYDFCYYWLHRLGHERIILWAAHVAHHQSEDYNLTTALRQTSTGFLLGWIFYLPMFAVGIPAEVVVTVGSINLIYQYWVHTEHIPKLGWYEWFFVTPSNHRVHHAQNDIYMDRNYGGLFILWDRLFGTFQEELDSEPVVFGIRGPLKSWNPVKALTHVYVDIARDSWHTARWRDKLGVWFARTGWRPADVAQRFPREKNNLDDFERFDPDVPVAQSRYVLAQFVLVALSTFWIGDVFARLGASAVLVPCLFVWFSLYSLGLINEGRPPARRIEQVRLLVVLPLSLLALHSEALNVDRTVWFFTGAYVLLSLLWIRKQ